MIHLKWLIDTGMSVVTPLSRSGDTTTHHWRASWDRGRRRNLIPSHIPETDDLFLHITVESQTLQYTPGNWNENTIFFIFITVHSCLLTFLLKVSSAKLNLRMIFSYTSQLRATLCRTLQELYWKYNFFLSSLDEGWHFSWKSLQRSWTLELSSLYIHLTPT